jgi:hypothetical protein
MRVCYTYTVMKVDCVATKRYIEEKTLISITAVLLPVVTSLLTLPLMIESSDSSFSIVTYHELDGLGNGVSFPAGRREFPPLLSSKTGCVPSKPRMRRPSHSSSG